MGKRKEFPFELILSISLAIHGALLICYDHYVIFEMTNNWLLAWEGRMPEQPSQGYSPPDHAAETDASHAMLVPPDEAAAIPDIPPPTLPPPPPPHELWETLFGEHGGTGDANANTPGANPMLAPEADEVQAYLGKEAYTNDINSSNPGPHARPSDGGNGGKGGAKGEKGVKGENGGGDSGSGAPPPPALLALSRMIAPSPPPSPFGFNPPPAPPQMPPRNPLSLIARRDKTGTLYTTTAPASTEPSRLAAGPATSPSKLAARHPSPNPTTRLAAASPATSPINSPLATTLPTTGPYNKTYALKTPATQPFDAALATTHPAEKVASAKYTTQPTTGPWPDATASTPTTLPANVRIAVTQPADASHFAGKPTTQPVAIIPPKKLPATLPAEGLASGRIDGHGATTSPIVDPKATKIAGSAHPAAQSAKAALNSPASNAPDGNGSSPGEQSTASAGGADPGIDSESESDAFAHAQYVYVNGSLIIRNGRKVKTVRPSLDPTAQLDVMSMQNPEVEVAFTIDDAGKVIDVEIIRSSGSNEVDQPVYRAAWKWWFEPVKGPDGKPRKKDVILVPFVWR